LPLLVLLEAVIQLWSELAVHEQVLLLAVTPKLVLAPPAAALYDAGERP
jgi:hypothetical protein